jgi:hypothetical protein
MRGELSEKIARDGEVEIKSLVLFSKEICHVMGH